MIYTAIAAAFRLFLRGVGAVRVEGGRQVPARGPALLCINHRSWWDIPIVGALLGRRVHFMAKVELFRNPLLAALFRSVCAFPVRREEADRRALRRALELLAAGEAVGVFPEGHRSASGELGRGRPGAAYLALASGVPVIPVAIAGEYRCGALEVRVGAPLDLDGYRGRRLRSRELTAVSDEVIMGGIATLLAGSGRSERAASRG